jgi:hypothetical protein
MPTNDLRLWQPPGDALDALASVLSQRWTAARSQQMLFWPKPLNWLEQVRQLTSAPAAADSSGTLPDPHPC